MVKRNGKIDRIKKQIMPILRQHNVKRAGLFGSYVKGRNKKSSDIDILVQLGKDISLLDFAGLKIELEEILGRKVDLVEYNTIKPLIKDRILNEQVIIL